MSAAPNTKRRREEEQSQPSLRCKFLIVTNTFFVFLLLPPLRLVSRSSTLRSRSRVCLRSAMQVDRLIFLLFFSLLAFYSPFDSLRWLCRLPVFRLFISPLSLPFFISFLKTRTKQLLPHAQNFHNPGGVSTGEKRKRNVTVAAPFDLRLEIKKNSRRLVRETLSRLASISWNEADTHLVERVFLSAVEWHVDGKSLSCTCGVHMSLVV